MEWLFIAIPVITVLLLLAAGYVKAPPDTAYIISGFSKPRILIGKAGIRIPFLERMDKLSLKMFSVDVKTTDYVPNAEYINVKVQYLYFPPFRAALQRPTSPQVNAD